MTSRIAMILLTAVPLLCIGTRMHADTIQLVNGDRLNGKVASLDDKQLVFRSASFGERGRPAGLTIVGRTSYSPPDHLGLKHRVFPPATQAGAGL